VVPSAIILRGPTAVGKSTVIEVLEAVCIARGALCQKVSLDKDWGPGESRTIAATPELRYPEFVRPTADLLLVELALGEPSFGTGAPGATRKASEWVNLLKATSRKLYLIRLSVSDAEMRSRLQKRENRVPTTEEATIFGLLSV
jgi:hypothetical protein